VNAVADASSRAESPSAGRHGVHQSAQVQPDAGEQPGAQTALECAGHHQRLTRAGRGDERRRGGEIGAERRRVEQHPGSPVHGRRL
jgi:hypothetical protein